MANRFQVGILKSHVAEFAFVADPDCFAEPFQGVVRAAELGGVTGEVVRDEPVVAKD